MPPDISERSSRFNSNILRQNSVVMNQKYARIKLYSGTFNCRQYKNWLNTLITNILIVLIIPPIGLRAESAETIPLGAVPVTIAAGTGTARTLSTISFPLLEDASIAGQARGRITAVTTNTITNSNAGWTSGQLSTAAAPCLIQITSGSAAGRIFLISTSTASTSTTITIDPEEANLVNLTTLGITSGASGDTYRILACDTLSSIFGTPATTGILGSTTSSTADTVQIMVSGTWNQYYYKTSAPAGWVRIGLNIPSNNTPIKPDTLVLFNRLGSTPINFAWLGQIPAINRQAMVRNSGLSALACGWPVAKTLGNSGIESIPGWIKSAQSSTADIVQILVSGTWNQYFHNGTQWVRVGLPVPSNNQVIESSSGFLINKKGVTSGAGTLSQTTPYSL